MLIGIIIINNEPGIDHLPGPDAHDIKFSVSSIAQQEGVLLESIYDEGIYIYVYIFMYIYHTYVYILYIY